MPPDAWQGSQLWSASEIGRRQAFKEYWNVTVPNTLAHSATSRATWEHFPHQADVGVRGFGASPAEAFEQAALALTAVITTVKIKLQAAIEVTCEARDLELLFVDSLNTIIYEMAVRHMVFGRFAVTIDGTRLRATLWGESVNVARHAPACEPKGATYTALRVAQDSDGRWSAGCVVDV